MRLQRIRTRAQQSRRETKMPDETPTPTTGKQAVGTFLKNKGLAIGTAVGAVCVATGDYLLGDSGIIPWIIGLGKTLWTLF